MSKNKKTMASLDLPSAEQYEAPLLSILMLQNHCYTYIGDFLNPNDFVNDLYRTAYQCIQKQAAEGNAFDARILSEQLARLLGDKYSESDIFDILLKICGQAITGTSSPEYAKIYARKIKDAALRREEILLLQRKIARLSDLEEPRAIILEDSIKELTEQLENSTGFISTGLTSWNLTELLQAEIAPRETILEPFLTRASLTMLYGRRGSGKSWISSEIAFAVASGGSFLNWKATKPHGVLILDGEMSDQTLQERFFKIAGRKGPYPGTKPLVLISPDRQPRGMPDLSTIEGQRTINKAITADIDLIIVDNLSTLSRTGKENEAESWLPLQSWALKLRAQGKAVLFVHHASRGGTARGTSRREDILDTVIALKQPEDYSPEDGVKVEIHFEKARHFKGTDAKPFLAELQDLPGNFRWNLKSLEQNEFDKIMKLTADGLSQREIAKELNVNQSTVSRHIRESDKANLYRNKGEKIYQ